MKQRYLMISMIIAIVLVSGCAQYGGNQNQTPSQTNSVAIRDFAFNPSTTTVKAGTTVTWTNDDSVSHTATSDTGTFDSGNVPNKGTFSYTFNAPGTYNYYCSIHPYMKGTILVQ